MLPAGLIGLAISPLVLLKVALVFIIIQQLEGNLISPRVQGERMNIHPLLILIVVLAAYLVFGVMGSLFAVPTYAVLRVIAKTYWEEHWQNYGRQA